jgi:cobalt-zinc-cadmium efflux system outer membrane protein
MIVHAKHTASPKSALVAMSVLLASATALVGPAAAETVTLHVALSRAAGSDPSLVAANARIDGAFAGVRQANRRVNPDLAVDVEDFAGSGQRSGFDQSETTVGVRQLVERGGKRQARRDVAEAQLERESYVREVRALDLFKTVEEAWVSALAEEAKIAVAEERLANATRFKSDIERRVTAARDPAFAVARVNAQVAQAKLTVEQARRMAHLARATLASYWHGSANFSLPRGVFANTNDLGPLRATIVDADLNVLESELHAADARVRLERARTYQDVTLRLGVRQYSDGDDVAAVAGIAIPFPLFDRNRDKVEQAFSEQTAAVIDIEALRNVRMREAAQLRARLAIIANEVALIDSSVLPEAQRAVALVVDGFNRGSFNYIDVIEAQRGLSDVRAQRIEALTNFHLLKAALARITGRHIGLVQHIGTR